MWTILLTAVLSAAATEVELRALEGETLAGSLVRLDETGAAIQTADGLRQMPLEAIAGLMLKNPPQPADTTGAVWVELVDGSLMVVSQYTVSDGRATLARPDGAIDIPTATVRSVRLRSGNDTTTAQWRRIAASDIHSDLLVVSRNNTLDYHRGVLGKVTDAFIQFAPEGETLSVNRSKVFGLVYYHPSGRELSTLLATLIDSSGSSWSVSQLRFDDGLLWATTCSGTSASLPLETIVRVDFTQGKIVYLDEMTPESAQWTPYLGAADTPASRAKWFGPRGGTGDDAPLRLAGKDYRRGLRLHSRTRVEYRLGGEFRRFEAIVGMDDRVQARGNVGLVIRADDRPLVETTIDSVDSPRPIALDLTGVQRLSIFVDFGEDLDVADHLNLVDARVVK